MTGVERFDRKIMPESSGCWIWIGCTNAGGYGQVRMSGRTKTAHRVIYELLRGAIPEGLDLDHLCRTRACVNPQHLEPVTRQINLLRGERATPTHCKAGHPLVRENIYIYQRLNRLSPQVRCKVCSRARSLAAYLRRTETTVTRRYTPRQRMDQTCAQ